MFFNKINQLINNISVKVINAYSIARISYKK